MGIPRRLHNKGNNMNNESTYTLLVRSEDKSRSILEVGVFGLIALSALLAFFQFAQETKSLPLGRVQTTTEHRESGHIAS